MLTPSTSKHNEPKTNTIREQGFLQSIWVLVVFLTFNILAALFVPIHDCDETFNYWEPTHYLSHGYGLQTWEYSPEYAIRSWLYIALHALIGSSRRLLPFASKVAEFYFIRYIFALTCSLSQTAMFFVVKNTINFRVAIVFMMSMIFSPGMFHSSVAYLPSSFSMFTTMRGISTFMDKGSSARIARGILWFSLGGIIGWPFSIVLCAPFLVEEIVLACLNGKKACLNLIGYLSKGILISLILLAFEILVSGLFYRRLVIVPLNIVLYNVLSGPGPNLYGTEPWDFYFRNLFLNFNFWFILALISLPLCIILGPLSHSKQHVANNIRYVTILSPFYLWLAIFSYQPHKEERFMYPVYPCLALNAAISLHIFLINFGNISPIRLVGKIPSWMKLLLVISTLLVSTMAGLARIYGIYNAYSAPLRIYNALLSEDSSGGSVCFGKEWYRFPSSYHLPNNTRAKFIKSEFRGLLPGDFQEMDARHGFRSGTWLPPSGLNIYNLEDPGKYTEISACEFLVDTYYPTSTPSSLEPHYILDKKTWQNTMCVPFLDAARTPFLGRILWLPEFALFAPMHWQQVWSKKVSRVWGKHCLLKNRGRQK